MDYRRYFNLLRYLKMWTRSGTWSTVRVASQVSSSTSQRTASSCSRRSTTRSTTSCAATSTTSTSTSAATRTPSSPRSTGCFCWRASRWRRPTGWSWWRTSPAAPKSKSSECTTWRVQNMTGRWHQAKCPTTSCGSWLSRTSTSRSWSITSCEWAPRQRSSSRSNWGGTRSFCASSTSSTTRCWSWRCSGRSSQPIPSSGANCSACPARARSACSITLAWSTICSSGIWRSVGRTGGRSTSAARPTSRRSVRPNIAVGSSSSWTWSAEARLRRTTWHSPGHLHNIHNLKDSHIIKIPSQNQKFYRNYEVFTTFIIFIFNIFYFSPKKSYYWLSTPSY